jgi:Fe(3+) dicitrate transport protein
VEPPLCNTVHNLRFSELQDKIADQKPFEFTSRNTIGSYGLFTNFTSVSGTNKNSVTTFLLQQGNGFRPNSDFESKNYFANLNYQLNDKTAF